MSIGIKHIWRNIKDKKLMSILIILSIAIAGAVLFVSLSIEAVLYTADTELQSVTTVFLMVFMVTCFMSIFVVFSSFKYIMALRIKTIGTFRSVGAGKKQCRRLLLAESIIYGFISSVLALILGIILLVILGSSLSGDQAAFKISPLNIFIAITFCVLLSPLCAFIPIKASEKYNVKEIILQTHTVKGKKRLPALIVGISLIVVSIIAINIYALKFEQIIVFLALLCSLAGFVIIAGPVIYYVKFILSKISPASFAVKNAKDSSAHGNIAVLLAIAVAVVFLINGANAILVKATDESFDLYNYQIQVAGQNIDDTTVNKVRALNGKVSGAAGLYFIENVPVKNHIPLVNLYGMTEEKVNDYFNFTIEKKPDTAGKTIFLSRDYLERENLKIGDKIILNNNHEYAIAGVIKEMFNNGNVGIISEQNFTDEFNAEYYTLIAVQSGESDLAAAELRAGFETFSVLTVREILNKFKKINADLFVMLDYLIILSTFAGIFGVMNNLLIAFNSQKRERALMRSVGMSNKQSSATLLKESLITGLTGGILGLLGGLLLIMFIPALLIIFEFPAKPVPISPLAITLCAVCSVIICMFAALISLRGNSKLNIIQTLREEIL